MDRLEKRVIIGIILVSVIWGNICGVFNGGEIFIINMIGIIVLGFIGVVIFDKISIRQNKERKY